jgi:hypothetical protein
MFGTMCKPLHAGKACERPLAAQLAARGFTSRHVVECPQGFAATQTDTFIRPREMDVGRYSLPTTCSITRVLLPDAFRHRSHLFAARQAGFAAGRRTDRSASGR